MTSDDQKHKELALRALDQMRGDDLYRARSAFGSMTPQELEQPHGQSGKTRAQILKEYEDWAAKVDAAIEWLKKL